MVLGAALAAALASSFGPIGLITPLTPGWRMIWSALIFPGGGRSEKTTRPLSSRHAHCASVGPATASRVITSAAQRRARMLWLIGFGSRVQARGSIDCAGAV